jgi:Uma2 family endonuclease
MTWQEILDDPALNRLEFRIESDRWGNVVMSPPPSSWHADHQTEIAMLLQKLMRDGRPLCECPIQTGEGVRACDVAWVSWERRAAAPHDPVYTIAPEICVEVQSPSNSLRQILERKEWFFEAGAEEFWHCDAQGRMHFYHATGPLEQSNLCPEFPNVVTID